MSCAGSDAQDGVPLKGTLPEIVTVPPGGADEGDTPMFGPASATDVCAQSASTANAIAVAARPTVRHIGENAQRAVSSFMAHLAVVRAPGDARNSPVASDCT